MEVRLHFSIDILLHNFIVESALATRIRCLCNTVDNSRPLLIYPVLPVWGNVDFIVFPIVRSALIITITVCPSFKDSCRNIEVHGTFPILGIFIPLQNKLYSHRCAIRGIGASFRRNNL